MIYSMRTQALAILALTLVACAGQDTQQSREQANTFGKPANNVETKATQAVTSPLSDLNLVHAKIPVVLIEAQKSPYLPPSDQSCEALAAEVRVLDGVLGADLDAPPASSDPGLLERGASVVTDAAAGAVKGVMQGAVPYRSWVRKLSGAEKYSKEVAAAITAGGVRRAYLKGIRQGRACPAASPG